MLDKLSEGMIGTADTTLFFHKSENSTQQTNELLQQSIGTEIV